jgi:DNA polymerase (family 10)
VIAGFTAPNRVAAILTGRKPYGRAADSLMALALPRHVLVAEDRLTEIPGVGDAIADIITKLSKSGTHPSLEKLRKEIPEGVLELLAVPGLRPEKVLRLYKDLGIASLAESWKPRPRTTASRRPKD